MGDILNNLFFDKIKGKRILPIVLIVLFLIAVWFILPKFQYDFTICSIPFDLILKILLTIVTIIIVIVSNIKKIEKNNTDFLGIGIYINSSSIDKEDIRKNNFFNALKDQMKNKYKTIVYEKETLEKSLNKKSISELMKELNLNIMFEISERTGTKNNKEIYEIKIKDVTVLLPRYIDPNTNQHLYKNFSIQLKNAVNRCLEICTNNDLNDIDDEVSLFELSIKYINCILASISNDPENTFKLLDELSAILKVTNINKKNLDFIKKNMVYRYIDAYHSTKFKILFSEPYYKNNTILDKLVTYHNNQKKYILQHKNDIEKSIYKNINNEICLQESVILYEQGKIREALIVINKCDLTFAQNDAILFNKAFLSGCDYKFEKSYEIYKKLYKRKHNYDTKYINHIIEFVEIRYELNEENIQLKFCLALLNFYFKDRKLAIQYLQELSSINSDIKKIYEMLKIEDNE